MKYIPKQGDIIWLSFTPQSGHEQQGRRPAIVISNDFFNQKTGLAVVCPIISKYRGFPLHIKLNNCNKIKGFVMIEQFKSVDYFSREAEFIEKASNELINEILSHIYSCF